MLYLIYWFFPSCFLGSFQRKHPLEQKKVEQNSYLQFRHSPSALFWLRPYTTLHYPARPHLQLLVGIFSRVLKQIKFDVTNTQLLFFLFKSVFFSFVIERYHVRLQNLPPDLKKVSVIALISFPSSLSCCFCIGLAQVLVTSSQWLR